MRTIFTFLAPKLSNENHHSCSLLHKVKIQNDYTFTAQDAGIISNAELSKHCDTTLQFLGKTPSFSLISSNNPDYDANSPQYNSYNASRFGLHDKLPNLTTLVTPTRF